MRIMNSACLPEDTPKIEEPILPDQLESILGIRVVNLISWRVVDYDSTNNGVETTLNSLYTPGEPIKDGFLDTSNSVVLLLEGDWALGKKTIAVLEGLHKKSEEIMWRDAGNLFRLTQNM